MGLLFTTGCDVICPLESCFSPPVEQIARVDYGARKPSQRRKNMWRIFHEHGSTWTKISTQTCISYIYIDIHNIYIKHFKKMWLFKVWCSINRGWFFLFFPFWAFQGGPSLTPFGTPKAISPRWFEDLYLFRFWCSAEYHKTSDPDGPGVKWNAARILWTAMSPQNLENKGLATLKPGYLPAKTSKNVGFGGPWCIYRGQICNLGTYFFKG